MRISIVVPLFNEEESLRPLYDAVASGVAPLGVDWEIIFVDDGSHDSSMDVLRGLHREQGNVSVLSLGRNLGKSAALAVGFSEARGEVVVTMDADLQDDPSEIPAMLAKLDEGFDLVTGWKRERKDPLSKRLPSKLFNWVTGRVSGVRLHDMNCGLKAYRQEVIRNIKVYGELHRYTPVLAHFAGFRVTEIPVTHHARPYGRSKFGPERFARGFFDLVTILFLRRYVTRPLHLFGMVGGVLFAGGFAVGVYLTVLKLMGESIGRRPLLTLGILLMVIGVQIVSVGLVAEMLASMGGERLSYPVRETLPRHGGGSGE
ncbi:MAG: glycosyltransferase family 2 protein [Candidatus Eisenbacteria bacterium]